MIEFKQAVRRPLGDHTFAIAEFAARIPDKPKAVIVMTPGSNGDGRSEIRVPIWAEFADLHSCALVGCHLTDKAPKDMAEQYIRAEKGSGDALLSALSELGLGELPLLLWGFSAGGEFNYELACWLAPKQPNRIKAFVVNKGGIYYTALAPEATRRIPAIFFIGMKDAEFRQHILAGIYLMNRTVGANWKQYWEKTDHMLGVSEYETMKLFAEELKKL